MLLNLPQFVRRVTRQKRDEPHLLATRAPRSGA